MSRAGASGGSAVSVKKIKDTKKPEWVMCPKCKEVIVLRSSSARRAGVGVCGHGPLCTREKCRRHPQSRLLRNARA